MADWHCKASSHVVSCWSLATWYVSAPNMMATWLVREDHKEWFEIHLESCPDSLSNSVSIPSQHVLRPKVSKAQVQRWHRRSSISTAGRCFMEPLPQLPGPKLSKCLMCASSSTYFGPTCVPVDDSEILRVSDFQMMDSWMPQTQY